MSFFSSAGIGRTGTYIGLDYTHEQAKAEGFVDVLKCAQLMRANRTNMIQTWVCYTFYLRIECFLLKIIGV